MLSRRSFFAALFAAPAVVATVIATSSEVEATPGAVNAAGCHGRPRHCHPRSQLRTMRNGRRYVAGHFGGRGRRGRRRRRR